MNNAQRSPGLPWILALVLANLLQHKPLESHRPQPTPLEWAPVSTEERLTARLWQDPLRVAYDALARNGDYPEGEGPRAPIPIASLATQLDSQSGRALVLPVFVRGGSWAEDSERRLRSRVAVVSALVAKSYTPVDYQRIGSCRAPRAVPMSGGGKSEDLILPYEWFQKDGPDGVPSRILVLWVDEYALGSYPLSNMMGVLGGLFAREGGGHDTVSKADQAPVRILGPTSSTTLKRMLEEDQLCELYNSVRDAVILSSWSTLDLASDRLGDREWNCGLQFRRMIGTDAVLAACLDRELELRIPSLARDDATAGTALLSGPLEAVHFLGAKRDHESRVLLVTEADTDYGRAWKNLFVAQGMPPQMLESVSYLRGVDGRVPGVAAREGSTLEQEEAASGESQLDYIRRLERRLADVPYDAIGVLGSDVYDKLAILQALADRYPDAVLFTTDLDARLFPTESTPQSMNLVVASHFGLTIELEESSRSLPPFRSAYQSALCLAVLRAVDGRPQPCCKEACGEAPCSPDRPCLRAGCSPKKACQRVRVCCTGEACVRPYGGVYEIGRGGAFRLRELPAALAGCTGKACRESALSRKASDDDLAALASARVQTRTVELWSGTLALFAVFLLLACIFRPVREEVARSRVVRFARRALRRLGLAQRPVRRVLREGVEVSRRAPWLEEGSLFRRSLVPFLGVALILIGVVRAPHWESTPVAAGQPTATASDVVPSSLEAPGRQREVQAHDPPTTAGVLVALAISIFCLSLFQPVRQSVTRFARNAEPLQVAFILGTGIVLTCAFSVLYRDGTGPEGEPFRLFSGISAWPTQFVRLIIAVFATFAVAKVWGEWNQVIARIQADYFPHSGGRDTEGEARLGNLGFLAPAARVKRTLSGYWGDFRAESGAWPRFSRALGCTVIYYLLAGQMFRFLGSPSVPTRGWTSYLVDRLFLFSSVVGVIFLTFVVVDASLATARFLRGLLACTDDDWNRADEELHARESGLREADVPEVFGVRLVEDLTTTTAGFLYLPAAGLFLMMFSRSRLFDKWTWSPALILILVFSFGLLLLVTRQISQLARMVKSSALKRLEQERFSKVHDQERTRELEAAIRAVGEIRGGALAGWREHPMARVLLLPFAGLGAASLLEFVYPLWMTS